ncbi:MAG: hypothetical protein R3F61_23365 [Myxococcota bacterium]
MIASLSLLLACRAPVPPVPLGTPTVPVQLDPLFELHGEHERQLLGATLFVAEALEVGRPALVVSSDVSPLEDAFVELFPPPGEALIVDRSGVRARITQNLEEFGRVSHVLPDTNGDGLADLVLRDNGDLRLYESPHPAFADLEDAAYTWRENDLPAAHGLRQRASVYPSTRLGGPTNELFHLDSGALAVSIVGPTVPAPTLTPIDFLLPGAFSELAR